MQYREAKKLVKKLLRGGQANEALQLTLKLRHAYPNDYSIHKLITKCKNALRKQELNTRKTFIKRGIKVIKQLRKDKKYESAINACNEVIEVAPEVSKVHRLLKKSQVDLIEEKLKDPIQKQWLAAEQYEKLYLFYQKIKKVFPEYRKINKLIKQTERQMIEKDRQNKKAFAAESVKKLQQLFEQGAYEKVIVGAEELIAFTHYGTNEIKKLLQKAQMENLKEIERSTYDYMIRQEPILEEAYKSGLEPIIKI